VAFWEVLMGQSGVRWYDDDDYLLELVAVVLGAETPSPPDVIAADQEAYESETPGDWLPEGVADASALGRSNALAGYFNYMSSRVDRRRTACRFRHTERRPPAITSRSAVLPASLHPPGSRHGAGG
jgi:hypothetical protein